MEPELPGAALYLDLLKRCLADTIYADDPLATMVPVGVATRPLAGRIAVGIASTVARWLGTALVEPQRTPYASHAGLDGARIRELREVGADWPPRAHTMIGLRRLDNLQSCVETVLRERIPGDLIETGVWRGGACILMRGILRAYGVDDRAVWVADSFRGLPAADTDRYPADRGDRLHRIGFLAVSRQTVAANFRAYDLFDDRVRFLEGWFADTLPQAPIDRLAVLRLDGDMYGSTMQVFTSLYDKVSPGGFVIVDDYSIPQCRQAVDDFRAARGIAEPTQSIDPMSAFWRKSRL
jgi:O-methyltransferase